MSRDISALVARLTLEEKAGLCSGLDFWHTKPVERLNIPSVMVSDGPHGLRKQDDKADHLGINDSIKAVCFPAACATAASFDPALLERMGSALGEECRAEGVSVLLGPAINIKRSPLCGRNFEYFSEDPYLAGKLAAAFIRGVQKWDVGTSVKHFAANNQEYRRMSCSSEMSEQTLREIYLPAFEIAVKEAKPWTMMCSYNRLNGEYASENETLLTKILREEWGFDGYVMSDWGAVNDRVKGLKAGLELEMPASGGENDAAIVRAVQNGKLDEAVLDRAVERMLNVLFRWVDASHPEAQFDRKKHHDLAVEIEKECAVLLKNSGVLPLGREQRVAYIGGFAEKPRFQGGGSSHINASFITSVLQCAGGGVHYAQGFGTEGDDADEALMAQAVEAAQKAEAAVVFAGLPDRYESEGYDRAHMQLPPCQNELIARVAAVQKNTVVVLHNGSPVEMPWASDVAAILEMYLGGEGVGEAADALLYGQANPCGRLPESFPYHLEDTPCSLSFPGDGKRADYTEGIYVGYRYYDTKKQAVQFPFGYGLSYTRFRYDNPRLSATKMEEGETTTVQLEVTNTGMRHGKEVIQLYVQNCTGAWGRPEKELKGFCKVALAPGETKTVSFLLDFRSLAYYSEELGDWYAPSGSYQLLLARSSREVEYRLPLEFRAHRRLPLRVDENTTVAELLADERTAPLVNAWMQAQTEAQAEGPAGEAAAAAISAEMQMQMMLNAPLRAMKLFAGLPQAVLQQMIDQLNSALEG